MVKPASLTFSTLQMSHQGGLAVPKAGRALQSPAYLSARPAQSCQSKVQPLLGLQLGLLLLEVHHEALDWGKRWFLQSKYLRRGIKRTF